MKKETVRTWAAALGVHHSTLQKRLTAAGHHVKRGDRFSAKQVFDSLLGDPARARTRESNARADLLELRKAERERELVSMDTARQVITEVFLPLKTRLMALATTIKARCNPSDPDLAGKAISEAIHELLDDAADAAAKAGASLK